MAYLDEDGQEQAPAKTYLDDSGNPVTAPPTQAKALAGSVNYASQYDPTAYAKLLDLQKRTGIPPMVSQGNEKQVSQSAQTQSLDPHAFSQANPRTAAWASNPDNAAVSGVDELHRLGSIEQNAFALRNFHNPFPEMFAGTWDTLKDMLVHPLEALLGADTPKVEAQKREMVRQLAKTTGDPFLNSVVRMQDAQEKPLLAVSGTQQFQRLLDPKSSNVVSRAVTGVVKGIEGLSSVNNLGLLATTALVPEDAGSLVSGAFAAQMGQGAVGASVQSAQQIGQGNYGNAAELIAGAGMNALFAATSARHSLMGDVGAQLRPAPKSEDGFHAQLNQAVDATSESELRKRSPDSFQSAMEHLFSGDESLRIPADRFAEQFGQQNVHAVAEGLGVTNYAEALLSGGDVEVPRANFFGKLEPEQQKALVPDIVDPATGMTARQAEEGKQQLQEWVTSGGAEQLQAETAAADAETASSPAYQRTREELRQRYVDAGEQPDVADTLAEKDANVYGNLAREVGMHPDELLRMYNPKVVSAGAPASPVLYQSAVAERVADLEKLGPEPPSSEILHQDAPEGTRGWFRVQSDGSYEIGKTSIGDLSTFVHEPAHGYLKIVADLAQRDGASDVLKQDYAKIREFLGADSDNFTREQQEKWARANEQYLREGRAPSAKLQGVFQRFALWLGNIYRKSSDLGVELTDDIRDVFDRMYAAEEGVDRAAAETGQRLFTKPEEAGWTDEQFAAYAEQNSVSVEQAKSHILGLLNEAAVRERSQVWRAEESNAREAITADIDQRSEYRAIRALRRGALDDGTPLSLDKDALIEKFGKERVAELQKAHPGLYRAEGGLDPESVAETLGYDSAQAMVDAIQNAPRRAAAIDEETRAYMTEKHGDIRYDGSLQDQARLAVENENRAASLHKELSALKRKLANAESSADAKTQAARKLQVAPLSAYREAAGEMIAGKAIADLQPTRYLDASRKYSREAFEGLRKGKYQDAIDAKHKELMNHFLFREASAAKDFVGKFENYTKKFTKKTVRERIAKAGGAEGQHVYLDQIDGLLGIFGLGRTDIDPMQARRNFSAFAQIQQQRAIDRFDALNPGWAEDHPGELAEIPQVVDASILQANKSYRNLTVDQVKQLQDTLKNVETLAKNDFGFIRDGKRVSFDGEVSAFQSHAHENLGTKPVPRSGTDFSTAEKAARTVQGLDAYMQKMEWFIDALDGGDVNGPARRNIKAPIDDANSRFLQMGDEVYTRLREVIDARPEEDVRTLDDLTTVQFPLFDRPLTRKQLISWALNLGTEENQKVALIGEGLVNADGTINPAYEQALGTLRSSEWKTIQGIWDTLNGMLPAVKEKALRTTGIEPKLKKVRSFDVRSADGEVVSLQGGYYPLKSEPGDRVGRLQNDPSTQTATGYSRPTTSTSHLKAVTGATYRLQMNYDSVLSRHLADVISDTTKGEAVAQVYKFINDDAVRTTIRQTLGEKYEPEFLSWLQDFVSDNKGAARDGSPLLDFMMSRKSGMVAARLGGNLASYLVQFGDVFKSIADADVKTAYLGKAFIDIRTQPTRMIQMIRDLSPNEMQYRERNFNREIRDMLISKGVFDQKKQAVTEFLMEGFQVMDKLITFPAWLARYRQGIAEHGDSGRAVREADRTIARDYQAGDNRNMSRMMRQGGWARLFTTFQGDANTWYGIMSAAVHSGNLQKVSVATFALIAEQIVGQYIRNRGPQDNENKAGWALEQALIAGVGKVPLFGDVAQYGISKLTGHYASLQNPTSATLERMASAPASVYKFAEGKKDGEEAARDVMEATGLFLGIPGTSQAIRTWKYVHNVRVGKEAPPKDIAEAAKGAVMGSNKKK